MKVVCDFHIHGKYSGGTSKNLRHIGLIDAAETKGINILGTGDCLHNVWMDEFKKDGIKELYDTGIFKLSGHKTAFILQTEVETIWRVDNISRQIHHLIFFPNFKVLEAAKNGLSKYGNLQSDGRPKLHISGEELVKVLTNINDKIEIVPAHIWTPYFGLYGSRSGFDSLSECYGSEVDKIHALETGLSADPDNCHMVSELDKITILSFSDCHSDKFHRIGREVTILDIDKISYNGIIDAIRRNKVLITLEFDPREGKYHYNGHSATKHPNSQPCFFHPNETPDKCPICGKKITIGVLQRIFDLADRTQEELKKLKFKQFKHIVPLPTLISKVINKGEETKTVESIFRKIVADTGEIEIWLDKISEQAYEKYPNIADAIQKIKDGNYTFNPIGADGDYGNLVLEEKKQDETPNDIDTWIH